MSFFNILIDWLHLLGAVAWIGGLIFMNLVFYPVLEALDPKERGKAMAVMAKRFAIISWSAVILEIITGIFNIPGGLGAFGSLSSAYKTTLFIKLVIIAAMIGIGGYVGLVLGPRIPKLAPTPGEKPSAELLATQKLATRLGMVNMWLGVLLLFFAATLLNAAVF